MKLESIELHNYRPYYGTSKEIFFEEEEGNIFLIQGRNGAGKTSLHEAVSWCLYGKGGGRSHYKKINKKALENGEEEMYVRLKFTHDGSFYNVVRRASTVGDNRASTSLKIVKDGDSVGNNENYRQNLLKNILPRNVSEFLFFDGEEMENLAKKMNGEAEEDKVKKQIELLIGLEAVRNAVKDLEHVRGEIDDEIDQERKKENEKEELLEELDEKKSEREKLENEITDFEEEKEKLENEKQQVEDRLERIESEQLEELQSLETEIDLLEDDRIPSLQDEYKDLIKSGHIFVLYDSIEDAIEEFKEEKEEVESTLSDIHVNDAKKRMVQRSLKDHSCRLCGTDIDPNGENKLAKLSEKFDVDEERREELEDKKVNLSNRISRLEDALRKGDGKSPAEVKQELERLRDRKEELQDRYDELEEEVESDQDEKSRLQSEKSKLEDAITDTKAKLNNRKDRLSDVNERIDSLREEIDSISETSVMAELKSQTSAIDDCIDDFNTIRDRLAKKKRDSILDKANEVFRKLTSDTRGYDRFEFIDEDKYGFQIISDDGARPNMDEISKGEKQIVALSFIIGLNRYADRDAPIIMDTPIARLDMEYRENLAALLANMDEQIILLVTDASLTGGFEEIMADDVSQKWRIRENTTEHTSDFQEAAE